MTLNLIWSIILSIVGIVGLYLAGSKKNVGWLFGIIAQILWVAFALTTKQYGFLLSAIAYGWVYSRNYIKWKRERKEESSDRYRT